MDIKLQKKRKTKQKKQTNKQTKQILKNGDVYSLQNEQNIKMEKKDDQGLNFKVPICTYRTKIS